MRAIKIRVAEYDRMADRGVFGADQISVSVDLDWLLADLPPDD